MTEKNDIISTPLNLFLSAELQQKDALHTLGENSAAILHELRSPLQAIRAHVQLLERKTGCCKDMELARHFLPIYQGIDHMSSLLEQFLRLSSLTALNFKPLDIAACLKEILPLLRSMAVMRDINFVTELEHGLPLCYGDEQQLKRLLFNLFANACDAVSIQAERRQMGVENYCPQIQMSLKREAPYIVLSVCDNGCGIGQDRLDKIWQPFYTNKPTGTGLGLPSCLAIATEHGGTLTVASKVGEGSRFTLSLPINNL